MVRHVAGEPALQSNISTIRAERSAAAGDLAGSARSFLDAGHLDPYNAVALFGEGVILALIARDRELAGTALEALRGTGSFAAVARLSARAAEAGTVALDGNPDAGRIGLLSAYAGLRDLGAARKQALVGLVMATVLGDGDAVVREAIDESRHLFEQMGAGLWLARLDVALAGWAAAPASARPASAAPASPTPA